MYAPPPTASDLPALKVGEVFLSEGVTSGRGRTSLRNMLAVWLCGICRNARRPIVCPCPKHGMKEPACLPKPSLRSGPRVHARGRKRASVLGARVVGSRRQHPKLATRIGARVFCHAGHQTASCDAWRNWGEAADHYATRISFDVLKASARSDP